MIKRQLKEDILSLLKQFPAVAIVGARQVGKTTLSKQVIQILGKPFIYLDLENPIDVRRLSDPYTFLIDNRDKCIIIDEVQILPNLFSILRSVIDANRRNGRFILLGSASPELVKGVSESLAGRIIYRELSPINFMELPNTSMQQRHWFRGGFPKALLAKTDIAATLWAESFIKSYAERDLNFLFNIDLTGNTIKRLLSMLAHINGSIWNAEMIARSLGITAPTVNRYIDYLEAAFLVRRVAPFFINTKKRLVKAPKIFIRDSGLLHSLSNIKKLIDLKGHPVVGSSWEGYVIEQIIQLKPRGLDLYYYRTQAGAEIDVVLANGVKAVAAIEIKLNNAPDISKGNFQSIGDLKTSKNFVIVPDASEYTTKENIVVCNLSVFLNKYLPDVQKKSLGKKLLTKKDIDMLPAANDFYTKEQADIIKLFCKAITEKKLIKFYYENTSREHKDWRTIEPYLLGIRKHNNKIFLTGWFLPTKKQIADKQIAEQKQYLIDKIDRDSLQLLKQTFNKIKVPRSHIDDTPTIDVICKVSLK